MSSRRNLRRLLIPLTVAALAGAALVTLYGGGASAASAPSSGCADVLVIAARGTGEPGDVGGGLSGLVSAVQKGTSKTVASYGVPYPAGTDFSSSVPKGVSLLEAKAEQAAADCPGQQLVLAGYSQGAWVVGDALDGSGLGAGAAKVAAVVLYGDPRFNSAETFDAGSFAAGVNGVYPRAKGALSGFSARIKSYCDSGDSVCQNGASGSAHMLYGSNKTTVASAFVLGKLSGATAGSGSGAGSGTGSGTAPSATTKPSATPSPTTPPVIGTPASAQPTVTTPPAPTSPSTTPAPTPPAKKHWWTRLFFWRH